MNTTVITTDEKDTKPDETDTKPDETDTKSDKNDVQKSINTKATTIVDIINKYYTIDYDKKSMQYAIPVKPKLSLPSFVHDQQVDNNDILKWYNKQRNIFYTSHRKIKQIRENISRITDDANYISSINLVNRYSPNAIRTSLYAEIPLNIEDIKNIVKVKLLVTANSVRYDDVYLSDKISTGWQFVLNEYDFRNPKSIIHQEELPIINSKVIVNLPNCYYKCYIDVVFVTKQPITLTIADIKSEIICGQYLRFKACSSVEYIKTYILMAQHKLYLNYLVHNISKNLTPTERNQLYKKYGINMDFYLYKNTTRYNVLLEFARFPDTSKEDQDTLLHILNIDKTLLPDDYKTNTDECVMVTDTIRLENVTQLVLDEIIPKYIQLLTPEQLYEKIELYSSYIYSYQQTYKVIANQQDLVKYFEEYFYIMQYNGKNYAGEICDWDRELQKSSANADSATELKQINIKLGTTSQINTLQEIKIDKRWEKTLQNPTFNDFVALCSTVNSLEKLHTLMQLIKQSPTFDDKEQDLIRTLESGYFQYNDTFTTIAKKYTENQLKYTNEFRIYPNRDQTITYIANNITIIHNAEILADILVTVDFTKTCPMDIVESLQDVKISLKDIKYNHNGYLELKEVSKGIYQASIPDVWFIGSKKRYLLLNMSFNSKLFNANIQIHTTYTKFLFSKAANEHIEALHKRIDIDKEENICKFTMHNDSGIRAQNVLIIDGPRLQHQRLHLNDIEIDDELILHHYH